MLEKKDIDRVAFSIEHLELGGRNSKSMTDRESFNFVESFSRSASKKQIIKFGKHNDHPTFLKELARLSSMHRSLVETKSNLTMGDNITFNTATAPESEKVYDWFNGLGLIDAREKISLDICTFGGFAMQHAYETDVSITDKTKSKRKLAMAYNHDLEEFRLLAPVKNEFGIYEPTYGAIHPCWGRSYRNSDITYLPLWFDDTKYPNFELDKDIIDVPNEELVNYQNRFFYYDKVYTNLSKYYPLPDYQTRAGLNAIILDGELIEFDVNELRNGLSVGFIVTFIRKDWSKEDPAKEATIRQAERNLVGDNMTGSKNNGRVTIARVEPNANNPESKGFDISEIPNNNTADRHAGLEERKNAYILVAHGIVAPEIAGISSKGTGFSSDADRIVDAIANLFFIRLNKFRSLMQRYYMRIAKEAGFDVKSVSFVDKIPFRKKIESAILKHAFLVDEIRQMNNYPALTDEQETKLNTEKVKSTSGEQTKLF